MHVVNKIADFIENICKFAIVILLVSVTIVLFVQIVCRYAFSYGIPWTDEFGRYGLIWMVFLATTVIFREGTHIAVTAIEETVPRLRKPLMILQKLICIVFMAMIGWFSILILDFAALQTSANMMLPMNYIYMCFPVCCVISIFYLLLGLVKDLGGNK